MHICLLILSIALVIYALNIEVFYFVIGMMAILGFVAVSSYSVFFELALEITFPLP